jgi:hypothetical protein
MKWGIDPMATAATKEKDPEVASGVTIAEKTGQSSVPEPRPTVQELTNDSTACEGEGNAEVEVEGKAREGGRTDERSQTSKSHVTLLPHIALLELMKSSRAGVCIILSLIWGLVWTGQESTVVLHLNRVWGLDPHGAGTAFIAAIVPTIFCESRVLLSFLNPTMHPDCVCYSRYSFWLAGRQVWPSSGWLCRTIAFLALVWVGHHRGLSRHVPVFFRS